MEFCCNFAGAMGVCAGWGAAKEEVAQVSNEAAEWAAALP